MFEEFLVYGGLAGFGLRLPGAFFTLGVTAGTGGGDELGAGEEG